MDNNPIRTTALRLLARREHSETELRQKLLTRDFTAADIQPVLNELIEEGLLSHTRFVENYILYRTNKGYGPVRIKIELLERGIHEELIEHHLKMADNAWFEKAQQVWKKRFKNTLPKDYKTRAQHMRFLQYRGFTIEQIEAVFS